MRLLVLGGTGFVGRALVEAALARGDSVTMLNRGRRAHGAAPGAGLTVLVGDRRQPDGLAALNPALDETALDAALDSAPDDSTWDAVVDTWSAEPCVVRDAAAALAGRVGRYVYISSRSVYAYPAPAGLPEDGPVVDGSPDDTDAVDYARAKRGGELAAEAVFGDRALVVRAGLILGPYEDIGRLPWWLSRIARGGVVLAPGPADLPLQYIDARDLALWLLHAIDVGLAGSYNLVSPSGHATMGALLNAVIAATRADVTLRWADPEAILAAGIEPWTELPVWLPPGEAHDAMHRGDVSKAVRDGLRCRPVTQTVADTWAWLRGQGGIAPQRADRPSVGLDPQREREVIALLD